MNTTIDQFRKRVLRQSLFAPKTLGAAIRRLGFVQADPIRSPARAQDLILRHRVKGYRAGGLERSYRRLGLEECFLFAYGFTTKALWETVHPKDEDAPLTVAEREALAWIRKHGPMHPKELEAQVGGARIRNYWGGYSRSSKMIMDALHDRGALRVCHREQGIRIYEATIPVEPSLSKVERFEAILLAALQAMGATTRSFLISELRHFDYLMPQVRDRQAILQGLINTGQVRFDPVDGMDYLSIDQRVGGAWDPDRLRILAPFDPVVRDRSRFEHLWGWRYRFEAYTPPAKRQLGYYAMPVLWRDTVIGWANAAMVDSRLEVDFGYVDQRPKDRAFREAAGQEVAELAIFLGLEKDTWVVSL